MLQAKPFNLGKLVGTIYDFPEINDVLPMHTHDETTVHISVIAKGSFKAHGDGWERTLISGNMIDWPAHQAHEFIALEASSRLINIVKG
jgi:quercetin dioxygenase-like cupin family protein